MRFRINRRESNLAKVSEDKAAEDAQLRYGLFAFNFRYFDKETRVQHKVDLNDKNEWIMEHNKQPVSNGTYMYAVGENGALYIGNPSIHSQFKAGKKTQSAGWIDFQTGEHSTPKIKINNCSGHYSPSLSQFVSTIHGLHKAHYLPDEFEISLNRYTEINYETDDLDFWEKAKANINSSDESFTIAVKYRPEHKGFLFTNREGRIVSLSEKAIMQHSLELLNNSQTKPGM